MALRRSRRSRFLTVLTAGAVVGVAGFGAPSAGLVGGISAGAPSVGDALRLNPSWPLLPGLGGRTVPAPDAEVVAAPAPGLSLPYGPEAGAPGAIPGSSSTSPDSFTVSPGDTSFSSGSLGSVGLSTGSIVTSGLTSSGIPKAALKAYLRAERTLARTKPGCRLDWSLVAGVGRVESDHGRFGASELRADGRSVPPIIGIRLDGSRSARISDSDGGLLDGDREFDRAVGAMQFIPGTWRAVAADGDGDGVRNVQDIDDAALAAGYYLCARGADLSTQAGRVSAVLRYNHSAEYVARVLALADAYASGGTGGVDAPKDHRAPSKPPRDRDVPDGPASPQQPRESDDSAERSAAGTRKPADQGSKPADQGSKPADRGDSTGGDDSPPATPKPGTDSPGTDDPGTDSPGTDSPGTDDPATDSPATDTPATDDPATDGPGSDAPGTNTPGADNPGADNPGADNPGADDPGAGTDDPGGDGSGDGGTVAPPTAPGAPDLLAASDSGTSDSDDLTNDATPTFTGTAVDGTEITLLVDGKTAGSATAANGSYRITLKRVSDAEHKVSAVASSDDQRSAASAALSVQVDTQAKVTLEKPELYTNDSTPTITFRTEEGATATCSLQAEDGPFTACTSPQSYPKQADGTYRVAVRVTDRAGNTDMTKSAKFVIDTKAPKVSRPVASLPTSGQLQAGARTVPVTLAWRGSDELSGIGVYKLQTRAGSGSFGRATSASGDSTSLSLSARSGREVAVTPVDRAGNAGKPVRSGLIRLQLLDDTDEAIQYPKAWARDEDADAYGDAVSVAPEGGKVVLSFHGTGVAWVARTGQDAGQAVVRVDGAPVGTVDLASYGEGQRQLVFVRNGLAAGRQHTLQIVARKGEINVDGFVVLRQQH